MTNRDNKQPDYGRVLVSLGPDLKEKLNKIRIKRRPVASLSKIVKEAVLEFVKNQ